MTVLAKLGLKILHFYFSLERKVSKSSRPKNATLPANKETKDLSVNLGLKQSPLLVAIAQACIWY
jgi:hypothetical protein